MIERGARVKVTINMCPLQFTEHVCIALHALHSWLGPKSLFTLPPGEMHCPTALTTVHSPSQIARIQQRELASLPSDTKSPKAMPLAILTLESKVIGLSPILNQEKNEW